MEVTVLDNKLDVIGAVPMHKLHVLKIQSQLLRKTQNASKLRAVVAAWRQHEAFISAKDKDSKQVLPLKIMLTIPRARAALERYLAREQSVEGIKFWIDVENFKNHAGDPPKKRRAQAKAIHDAYLAPAAPLELRWVDVGVRTRIAKAIKNKKLNADLFAEAQLTVLERLDGDSYKRFLESDDYTQLINSLAEDGAEIFGMSPLETELREAVRKDIASELRREKKREKKLQKERSKALQKDKAKKTTKLKDDDLRFDIGAVADPSIALGTSGPTSIPGTILATPELPTRGRTPLMTKRRETRRSLSPGASLTAAAISATASHYAPSSPGLGRAAARSLLV